MIFNIAFISPINNPVQVTKKFPCFQGHHAPSIRLVNEDRLVDAFIKTTQINTNSVPYPKEFPSTEGQKKLAHHLKAELEKIDGLHDVRLDPKHHVVYATLPHNLGSLVKKVPVIGLTAHLDNFWAVSSDNIKIKVHDKYSYGDVTLGKDPNIKISEDELTRYKGERLITSDGTTQIGADDKAGIAEILEVLKIYSENPQIKHPTIRVAFTPDEENGQFIQHFNLKDFNVDYAYVLDAKDYHTYESDNFNANHTEVVIKGKNLHPGYAKGKLINAVTTAADFIQKFPKSESPETTEGYEGFYFVTDIEGNPQEVKLNIVVRDHNIDRFNEKIERVKQWAQEVKDENPGSDVIVSTRPLYRNVKDILNAQYPEMIESTKHGIAKTVLETADQVDVTSPPVRGGSDAVMLVQRGLPAICIPAGYKNAHGKNEFTTVEEMKKCTANVLNIMSYWVDKTLKSNSRKD